jgi:ribonuclease G
VGDVLPPGESAGDEADEDAEADPDADAEEDGESEEEADGAISVEADESAASERRPVRPRLRSTRRSFLRRQRIAEVLKPRQEVIVQVTKGTHGTKGARVSTRISLPGRYLVLMPEADNVGISRKITDREERDRLRQIGTRLRLPGYGIIIRTESEDKTEAELTSDRDFLVKLWRQIQEAAIRARAPALVHKDLTLVNKTIRDIFGSDVSRLLIDDPVEYEKACDLLDMVSPRLRGRIQLYSGEQTLFDHFNVEQEIEKSLKRKVWLRSGGYLVIDSTEALTVIDVNTGKFTGGGNLAETILKTNIDAANEAARQLRLRDIGGIIVIDFIDMNSAKDREQVKRVLETALKRDRARTKVFPISPLGLVEMTRKRTAETISEFMTDGCPACSGKGKLPSAESVSLTIEQELRRVRRASPDRKAFLVQCHPSVAEILIGSEGANVDGLERSLRCAIYVRASAEDAGDSFTVSAGDLEEMERKHALPKRSQVVECSIVASSLQGENAVVGWAGDYLLEFSDGKRLAGQRAKAKVLDPRRCYATARLLSAGSA